MGMQWPFIGEAALAQLQATNMYPGAIRDTVSRMAQFNRHRKNAVVDPKFRTEPWRDAGYVAWLGWGGDTGVNWAIRTMQAEKN